jgi:hypothetical protein
VLGADVRVDRRAVAVDGDDVAGDGVVGRRVGREAAAEDLDVVAERHGHRRDGGDGREVERHRVGEDGAGQVGELLLVRDVGVQAEEFDDVGAIGESVHGRSLPLLCDNLS